MDGAEFISKAVTTNAGYDLIDLGAFPGAISKDPGFRISGEVWEIPIELMAVLDKIEGYPTLYNRKTIDTTQGSAIMYYLTEPGWYQNDPTSQNSETIITNGDTLTWPLT